MKLPNPIKTLIVEDVREDIEMIIDILETAKISVNHESATSRKEFERLIKEFDFDLVMVDYTLEDLDGLEAMAILREKNQFVPVIFVTGTLGVEKAVNVMQQGANDFILKSNLTELPKAVYKALRDSQELIEKERVSLALKESEERFRTIADSAPVLIYMLDNKMEPTFFNQQWAEFVGVDAPQLPNQWKNAIPREYQEKLKICFKKVIEDKKPQQFELKLKNHQGDFFWMRNSFNPRFGVEGHIEGVTGALIDITDEKLIDLKKNEFLSVASHELKTPLSTVKAYLELLNEELENKTDLKLYAEKAEKSANKLHKLVVELLDISRFENGYINIQKERFNFDLFLKEVVTDYQSFSKNHKIILKGSSNAKCLGDKEKIGQVFGNLLSNAIKYTPDHGEIIVSITLSNGNILASVADKGIGIPKEFHTDIFDRFFRVSADAHLFSGLGVGLYISKQIVELHNGSIEVESEKDIGSTFTVVLPSSN